MRKAIALCVLLAGRLLLPPAVILALRLQRRYISTSLGRARFYGTREFLEIARRAGELIKSADANLYQELTIQHKHIFLQENTAHYELSIHGMHCISKEYTDWGPEGVAASIVHHLELTRLHQRRMLVWLQLGREYYSEAFHATAEWLRRASFPEELAEAFEEDKGG